MAAGARTRSAPGKTENHIPSRSSTYGGIQRYGRVTKVSSQLTEHSAGKKSETLVVNATESQDTSENKKRKRDDEEPFLAQDDSTGASNSSNDLKRQRINDLPLDNPTSASNGWSPKRSNSRKVALSASDRTPTKHDSRSLETISRHQSPLNFTACHSKPLDTPLTTSVEVPQDRSIELDEGLPAEIHDLFNLNAALLKALSLHYAHHGAISPVDTRTLRPVVSKMWARRAVTLEDIQRCIGVMQADAQSTQPRGNAQLTFHLSDYGRGKICIERPEVRQHSVLARHLDEDTLQENFERHIQCLWRAQQKSGVSFDGAATFMSHLPLAAIIPCSSLQKAISSSVVNGQRRLEDLKGIALKAQASNLPSSSSRILKTPSDLKHRNSSLLERLKSKEIERVTQPSSSSPSEIARIATLQRLPGIIAKLPLPKNSSSGSQRSSYALPMLVQSVQDSSKNVVGKEEVEGCLRLLSEQGETFEAEGFVKFVGVGLAEAVVLDWARRPADLEKRIRAATAT